MSFKPYDTHSVSTATSSPVHSHFQVLEKDNTTTDDSSENIGPNNDITTGFDNHSNINTEFNNHSNIDNLSLLNINSSIEDSLIADARADREKQKYLSSTAASIASSDNLEALSGPEFQGGTIANNLTAAMHSPAIGNGPNNMSNNNVSKLNSPVPIKATINSVMYNEWPSRPLSRSSTNSMLSMTAAKDGVEGKPLKRSLKHPEPYRFYGSSGYPSTMAGNVPDNGSISSSSRRLSITPPLKPADSSIEIQSNADEQMYDDDHSIDAVNDNDADVDSLKDNDSILGADSITESSFNYNEPKAVHTPVENSYISNNHEDAATNSTTSNDNNLTIANIRKNSLNMGSSHTHHKSKILNINDSSVRKAKISSSPLAKDVSFSETSSIVNNNGSNINSPAMGKLHRSNTNISNVSVSSSVQNNNAYASNSHLLLNNSGISRIFSNLPNEPPITLNEKINMLRPSSNIKKLNPLLSPNFNNKGSLETLSIHSHNNSLSNINMMLTNSNHQNIIVDEKELSKQARKPTIKNTGTLKSNPPGSPLRGKKVAENVSNYENINGGGGNLFLQPLPNPTFNRLVHMTSLSTVGGISDFEDDESSLNNYRP